MALGVILFIGLTSFPMANMDACKRAIDEIAGACIDQNTGEVVRSKKVDQGIAGMKSFDSSKLGDLLKQELKNRTKKPDNQ